MNNYELIVGLEIHVQLNTKSKMFSGASNDVWQEEPNSHVTPVEIGFPGALPVPNKKAVVFTQRFGKALGCNLPTESKFDRKNYFYPDLPKGYQISQYDQPLCAHGFLDITLEGSSTKRITIRRIHLEEDTGKSLHKSGKTYLDFNKAGTPLMELVTEPDFRTPEEVSVFSKMIQTAVRTLGISNGDMEKGNMRLEANISVRQVGETKLPQYRVEIKNINSFKFLRDAISYEFKRQVEALEAGDQLFMETRGWNSKNGVTVLQRRKETESDYRYFPEPDIPPMVFDSKYFDDILKDMPIMPWDLEIDLIKQGIRQDYAHMLAYDDTKYLAFAKLRDTHNTQELVKLIVNTKDMDTIGEVIENQKQLKENPGVVTDTISTYILKVINENPDVVKDYKAGKENAMNFLLGQVMKLSQGKANAKSTRELLIDKLNS